MIPMLSDNYPMYPRDDTMKPAHTFRAQVKMVAEWFNHWNDIEQTIACYLLLKRLGPTQARFLSLVLEHTFKDSAYEVGLLEKEANSKEFLMGLCHKSKDFAVQSLLLHLPLLHPGNNEAKQEYFKLLPKILSHSLEYSIHEEECRQLLSLALVHPAFTLEERSSLQWWLGHLEDKDEQMLKERQQRPHNLVGPQGSIDPQTGFQMNSKIPEEIKGHHPLVGRGQINGWRPQPRHRLDHKDSGISTSFDNGLGSPGSTSHPGLGFEESFEEFVPRQTRVSRSSSFPVDPKVFHAKISPQPSVDSDDDIGTRRMGSPDEMVNTNADPGMRDVPCWLKSLRLHKYYNKIFHRLTYDEMMNLKDEYLEKESVTKGARNKILLSIQKLRERPQMLVDLEKDVLQPGKLQTVLAELKQIVITPIRAYHPTAPLSQSEGATSAAELEQDERQQSPIGTPIDPEDLPSQIVKVMGKACTQILVTQPDEECCMSYLWLLDRVLSHEAFTPTQKRRLQSWRVQCQKLAKQLATSRKIAAIEKGPRSWYADPLGPTLSFPGGRRRQPRGGSLKGTSSTGMGGHRPVTRANTTQINYHKPLGPAASVTSVKGHQAVCRTKSAPIRSSQPVVLQPPRFGAQDTEGINQSLETLCLSMTEHALSDSADKHLRLEEQQF